MRRERSSRQKFLHAHAERVDDEDRAIGAHRDRVRAVELAVVVAEAAEGRLDRAVEIEPQRARAIGRRERLVAAVDDVGLAVGADRDPVGPAQRLALPLGEEAAAGVEDLDARVAAIGDVDATAGVDGDAVRQIELAGAGAARAELAEEAAARRSNRATRALP